MNNKLKYKDEVDKSLGISGMVVSLVVYDADSLLASVSLEEGEEAIDLSSEFFFPSNPRMSARIAWKEIMRHFEITTALAVSNALCRSYAGRGSYLPSESAAELKEFVIEEGRDHCDLDEDEINAVFDKCFSYFDRIFAHPSVRNVATDFAARLRERRRMSAGEALELMHALRML